MFTQPIRKKFAKQSLLKILQSDKNPFQAYKRIRKNALQAISDLSLLASRLPDDKLYEIFNEKTLGPLFTSIFYIDKSENISKLRRPNVQLASFLVDQGITHCLSEYEKWNKDTPESSKPTIEYLQRAVSICKEIGYKYLREYIDNKVSPEKIREKKNKLICIWERKLANDYDKFKDYFLQEMDYDGPDLVKLENIDTKKINELHFVLWIVEGPEHKELAGSINIVFSLDKKEGFILDNNKGTITFYNQYHKEMKSKKIRILKFGSEHALVEE